MKNSHLGSNKLTSNCPICNSNEQKILVEYNSQDALSHLSISPERKGYLSLKNQIIERWNGDKCQFVECSDCDFNYAVPFVAGSKELYSFFYDRPEAGGSINWEHITAEKWILRKFGENKLDNVKLFEFGAGDGSFIKSILGNGFKENNIVCTEASENCQTALNQIGIRCLSTELSLLKTDEFKNRFDVIVLFQVLEHLDGIGEIFNAINFISKSNCSLLIAVPNNVMRRFYEKNGIFLDVPPVHISRWSEKSFKLIGEKYGWKIKEYEIQKTTLFSTGYEFIWNKTLNKSVGGIKRRYLRKSLIALLIVPLFVINLFKIINIKSNSNGVSQLVHLEKI